MRSISEAILRFFELVEAEGRALRKSSVAVVENMLVIFFGFALMFFGVVVGGISLYLWLSTLIGRAGAASAVGAALFVLGAILLLKGHSGALEGKSLLGGDEESHAETQIALQDDGGELLEQAE
ncbi:hypothetical protein LJC40_01500 [Synergistaceae bacterium OttesenSCG-928-D05]|nr:hypothetical protein [Synergistaceae bacterium OttesenSCG-928-D05]